MSLKTISEAARIIGVHPDTLRRWANEGAVPFTQLPSGHKRWSADQLRQIHESLRRPAAEKVAV